MSHYGVLTQQTWPNSVTNWPYATNNVTVQTAPSGGVTYSGANLASLLATQTT